MFFYAAGAGKLAAREKEQAENEDLQMDHSLNYSII